MILRGPGVEAGKVFAKEDSNNISKIPVRILNLEGMHLNHK